MHSQDTCARLMAWSLAAIIGYANAQTPVVTSYYDNGRTGARLVETQLNTANVNQSRFGRLFRYQVDGTIYAQPLYLPNLTIPGKGTHNVLFVATMNNTLYAFDADSPAPALWTRNFGPPVPIADAAGQDNLAVVGPVGIMGTPVISTATNTLYVVARNKQNGGYFQRLHAIDVTTGAEKFGGPVDIQASVPGTGAGSVGGTLAFNPLRHLQRVGLALAGGNVIIAWASHEDIDPYHGWVMAYSASTLQQVGVWCNTPTGIEGGIWQCGRAPAIDGSGNVYFSTGNGSWDGVVNFGMSFVKLTPGLQLLDWFTPDNWVDLNAGDKDLGSAGPMLIPNTSTIVSGGKQGVMYLVDTRNMGHTQVGNRQIVQFFQPGPGMFKAGPVYWNSPTAGPLLYLWNQNDFPKAYQFNGSTLNTTPLMQGTLKSFTPGGTLSISANGSNAGTGILWAALPVSQSLNHGVGAGVVRAYDASDLSKELWNSLQNQARDDLGFLVKYNPPTVANGKVYVGSASNYQSANYLNVYGLFQPDFTIEANPPSAGAPPGTPVTYTVTVTAQNGFSGVVNLSVTGLPAGASAVFNPTSITNAGTSTLTVTTTANTPLGSSTLNITGTTGTITHSITAGFTAGTAKAISIDFVGQGTAMAASESAGVVPKTNWNRAVGSSSPATPLVDEFGASTGATVAWSSNTVWKLPSGATAGNTRMMQGYIDTVGASATTVTVSGLVPSATGYDVYVYTDGDNPAATRNMQFQLSGAGSLNAIDTQAVNFSGTFVQGNGSAGNYVKFSLAGSGFTLTAIPVSSTDSYQRAPVNGIQIVPASTAPAPDFALSLAPGSRSVVQGASTTYTVTVAAAGGFNGAVNLSAAGLPSGVAASFNPATVTGSGTSTMTVAAGAIAPIGSVNFTVTGASGALSRNAGASLAVTAATADFGLSAAPGTQAVAQGGSTSYTVTVTPANGFNGSVAFSASGLPSGATASFNPPSVTGSGSSTMTVAAGAATPTGTAALTVSATSGSLTHTTGVSLTVNPAGSSQPPVISIDFVGSATAMSAAETAGVIPASNWNSAAGSNRTAPLPLVDDNGAATAATVVWSNNVLWKLPTGASSGDAHMMQGYLDTLGNAPTTVTVSGLPSGSYDVYVYTDGDNTVIPRVGAYEISGPGITTSTLNASDAARANFSGAYTSGANYVKFTIGATGFTLTARPVSSGDVYLRAPVNGIQIVPASGPVSPDFSVAAAPGSQNAAPGGSADYTVTVNALNGFNGAVSLAASGLPSGASASFNPPSLAGGGSSTLTVTTGAGTPVGASTITVTAVSGALSHSATVGLTVGTATQTKVISIDFVGRGSAMNAFETAGVVPKAQWNNASGAASGAPLALKDETGAPSGATATWTSEIGWNLPIADAAGNAHMMFGYLDTLGNTPTTVNVSGLPANAAGYDVYVYMDGDNGGAARTGAYQVGGVTLNATDSGTFNGAFTQGSNYLKFSVTTSGFTLTATAFSSADRYMRAPLNGIQIVPR